MLDRTVRLPFGEFPGAVVLGMAATEQFTHGWDLARATGQPTDLDPDLAAELLGQARLVITDAYRGPDGEALFGPAPGPGRGEPGRSAGRLPRPGARHTQSMTDLTTIKVSVQTRDRLRRLADEDRLTLDAELARTLDRAEEARFWRRPGATTHGCRPALRSGGDYAAELAEWDHVTGDGLDGK